MSYSLRATNTDDNAESRVGMKKEPLVRWMTMPNVVTKESPNTQRRGYSPRATKADGDAEGRARQVPAHSGRVTVRGL